MFGKRDDCDGAQCKPAPENEPKPITVEVPTGKWVEASYYGFSSSEKVVDERRDDVYFVGSRTSYFPHKKPIPIEQAVELIIKHLGVQLDYELPKDPVEEKINGLKKIKKTKKK